MVHQAVSGMTGFKTLGTMGLLVSLLLATMHAYDESKTLWHEMFQNHQISIDLRAI